MWDDCSQVFRMNEENSCERVHLLDVNSSWMFSVKLSQVQEDGICKHQLLYVVAAVLNWFWHQENHQEDKLHLK